MWAEPQGTKHHTYRRAFFASFLGLVAGVLLFSSCADPTVIGKSALIADQRGVIMVDTFTVYAETRLVHDTTAENTYYKQSSIFTGSYLDPDLGLISARAYLMPWPAPSTDTVLMDSAGIHRDLDSMVIKIPLNSTVFGHHTGRQTFNLHLLIDTFRTNDAYYSNSNLNYTPDILARATLNITKDTLTDTLRFVTKGSSQNPLLYQYADRLLNTGRDTVQLDSLYKYNSKFRGWAIVPENPAADGDIIGLNFTAATATLRYHLDGYAQKGYNYRLYFNSSYLPRFTHYDFVPAQVHPSLSVPGTAVSSKVTGNKVFMLPQLGIVPYLYIPGLNNLVKEQKGNITVTRAELLLKATDTDRGTDLIPKLRPMGLIMAATNDPDRGVTSFMANSDAYTLNTGAALAFGVDTLGYYRMPITLQINSILRGTAVNNGWWLTYHAISSYTNPITYFTRNVLVGPGSGAPSADRMKLRIYYLKLKPE